jgi:hypothetical protein
MLGLRPTCALGKSASHKINKVRTWLAKCTSRAQAKCAFKSTPGCLVSTLLAPDRTTPTLMIVVHFLLDYQQLLVLPTKRTSTHKFPAKRTSTCKQDRSLDGNRILLNAIDTPCTYFLSSRWNATMN